MGEYDRKHVLYAKEERLAMRRIMSYPTSGRREGARPLIATGALYFHLAGERGGLIPRIQPYAIDADTAWDDFASWTSLFESAHTPAALPAPPGPIPAPTPTPATIGAPMLMPPGLLQGKP